MGGKQKQGANRVKNNAKPSSSSRSAEILGGVPSFGGFCSRDGLTMAILPGLASSDRFDCEASPEFLVVFKKMSKKDVTTKLKALDEFSSLVSSSSDEDVRATLPVWPRLYGLLSGDVEHRVREAAQSAHEVLVTKCGKAVAPYLKQLAPVWIISQYDTYVPAATKAQTSFQKTFPSKKLPEVMVFCKVEILSYIRENLIEHSPTTFSNPKTNTPVECEAKYERAAIASLYGYSLFLNHLPDDHIEWLCAEQENILDSNKFWSFGKHKSNQIRAAWYAVVGSLCQRIPSWFNEKYGKRAIDIIFSQLNEKESTIMPQIWENAILLMSNVKEWWTYMDPNKNVLSGILTTLKFGGWGSAEHIAPLLLPMYAQLFSAELNEEFFDEYFSAILKGLEIRSIISSKSECSAWLKGLSECIKYLSINGKENVPQAVSRILRQWLETVARSHMSINPFTPLKLSMTHFSELSIFWTRQSLTSTNENVTKYSQILRLFWQNLSFTLITQLENMAPNDEVIKEITDIQREILFGLRHNLQLKVKRASKVKFLTDEITKEAKEENDKKVKSVSPVCQVEADVKQSYERELNNLVYHICCLYLTYARDKSVSMPILGPLHSLIVEFDKIDLFNQLLQAVLKDETDLYLLYSKLLIDWVKGPMRSQAVVDIVFCLFNYLSCENQRDLLKSFDQIPTSIVKWCITRCLAYPFCTYESIREWLHSERVHESLISLCRDVIKEGDRGHATLLKMCFAQDESGDVIISKKTSSSIIDILTESLTKIDSLHLDLCASFTSQLASTISYDKAPEDSEKLLISLFRLNTLPQNEYSTLSNDTWWEVNTSWQDVLSSLDINKMKSFAHKAMDIIYSHIISEDVETIDFVKLDNFVHLTNNIILSCTEHDCDTQEKIERFAEIAPIIFKTDSAELTLYFDKAHKMANVSQLMNCELILSPIINTVPKLKELVADSQKQSCDDLTKADLNNLLKWICFNVKVFDKMLFAICSESDQNNKDDEDDSSVKSSDSLPEFVFSHTSQEMFSDLLYRITVLDTLYNEYKSWCWHSLVADYFKICKDTVCSILKLLSNDQHDSVIEFMESKNSGEDYYWTCCLKFYCSVLKSINEHFKHSFTFDYIKDNSSLQKVSTLPIYSTLVLLNDKDEDMKTKLFVDGIVTLTTIYMAKTTKSAEAPNDDYFSCCRSVEDTLLNIVNQSYEHKEIMLYDVDFSSTEWQKVECNTHIANYLITAIKTTGWTLDRTHWDFINISLSSMLQSLDKTKSNWNTVKYSLLASSVFRLYCVVNNFIKNIPEECTKKQPSDCIVSLPAEWKVVFIDDITLRLMNIFLAICEDCGSEVSLAPTNSFLIDSLHEAMKQFDWKYFNKDASHKTLITKIEDVLEKCLNILNKPVHHSLKFLCYTILKDITPLLIQTDDVPDEHNEMPVRHFSIHKIMPSIIYLEECLAILLDQYKINESSCTLIPHTDSFNLVLGYLLLWDRILEFVRLSIPYLQQQFAEVFKVDKHVEKLVETLFRLLPYEIQPNRPQTDYFTKNPMLSLTDPLKSELLGELSCMCLLDCLKCAPAAALVRSWWGSLPSKLSQFVEQIIKCHVTPELIKFLFKELSNHIPTKRRDFQIAIHLSTNEMLCTYKYEDTRMELFVTLGATFPLCVPHVVTTSTCSSNVAWIAMFLSFQNSSLWRIANLWLNSIERKLEVATECYICYNKLHSQTGDLAKEPCKTCRHKFHPKCIFRWFSVSGKTACPLCRNRF